MRKRHLNGSSAGFTLVEILVVIAILGLLAALLIPAVQAARESSRLATCSNHLRQIGIALAGHQSVVGEYPAGFFANRNGYGYGPVSIHARLLPYIEKSTTYNHLNLTTSPFLENLSSSPRNLTAANTVIETFLCPSDPMPLSPGNSYRGNVGVNPYTTDSPTTGGGGVFLGFQPLRDRDITDGLSQTVGFSERNQGGSSRHYDAVRDIWLSGLEALGNPTSNDQMEEVCASLASTSPPFFAAAGRAWIAGGYENTLYNHVAAPNQESPDCAANSVNHYISGGSISARSFHPNGVHILLMDGSVRVIKEAIALPVWRSLSTRNGGETISNDDY